MEYKDPKKIFSIIMDVCDYLLETEDRKKTFCDAVLAMTKANALCGVIPEATELQDEIAFFQAVRVALTKKDRLQKSISDEQVQNALRQVVSNAIVADKIVDIFEAAGLHKPDISILSEEFLRRD